MQPAEVSSAMASPDSIEVQTDILHGKQSLLTICCAVHECARAKLRHLLQEIPRSHSCAETIVDVAQPQKCLC
jgi:hypothetical protein